jgi:hypothetical protein
MASATSISRRTILAAAVAAGAGARAQSLKFDLTSPGGQRDSFLRLAFSTAESTLWYWYTGVVDLAAPGEPIAPLIGVDTLIRRRIEPQRDASVHVTSWEANYFHPIGGAAPLHMLRHARLERAVRPYHWREGPTTFVFSDRSPRVLGSDILPASDTPFAMRWQQAAGRIWTTREIYAAPRHPLPLAAWPLESSGERLTFNSVSTYTGLVADMARDVPNVPCSFNYQAIMPWFPWLMLGQRPGHLVWRANGSKLATLADVPAEVRAAFAVVHPSILEDVPWTQPTGLWQGYMNARTPAR